MTAIVLTVLIDHSYSPCLMEELGDVGKSHSPLHGFAYDGYPIYGPYQAANTLAVSCWQARDYSSTSVTGCSDGKRSCVLKDPYNYKSGTTTTSSTGPTVGSTVTSQSSNSITASSGVYFEDYFFNSTCYARGGQYLDSHNGHDHDDYGYHYHLTMDSTGVPTFPFSVGPKYYGCLPSKSQLCGTSYLFGALLVGTSYGTGTSSCGPTAADTNMQCTINSFTVTTRAPSVSPALSPTSGMPTKTPTALPTQVASKPPSIAPSQVPTFVPTLVPTQIAPSRNPTVLPTSSFPVVAPSIQPSLSHAPTAIITSPSTAPTAIASVATTSSKIDYSCLHWNNWRLNRNGNYSTIFSSLTDILTSSYISSSGSARRRLQLPPPPPPGSAPTAVPTTSSSSSSTTTTTTLTTGWKVTFKGIPLYYHNMTTADITKLNSRPKASTDFSSNSKTTAKAGTYYKFGTSLGYASTRCTLGYWPQGPDCPSASDRNYVFPIRPAPENSTSKFMTVNHR